MTPKCLLSIPNTLFTPILKPRAFIAMSNSGTSTPRAFASQAADTEDLLKDQTVGLVHLDDFRKRRRDVQDAKSTENGFVPKSVLLDSANLQSTGV